MSRPVVILTIKINRYKKSSNVDRSNVLYSYVFLSGMKSAGVTEITTFERTLDSPA